MITVFNETKISSDNDFTVVNHTFYEGSVQGVYLLYNIKDELIYVGQTNNLRTRLSSHCKNENKEWTYAHIIPIPHKEHRLFTEAILIRYLNPINNKANGYPKSYGYDVQDLFKLQVKLMQATEQLDFISNLYFDTKFELRKHGK